MTLSKTQSMSLSVVVGIVAAIGVLSLTDTASARALEPIQVRLDEKPVHHGLATVASKYKTDGSTVGKMQDIKLVREYYRRNEFGCSRDYTNAASVLGNSKDAEDVLLASELALAALAMGFKDAGPLAAWTHDRYQVMTGHTQRFGTLRNSSKGKVIVPVSKDVTDHHRKSLGLPSLADLATDRAPTPKTTMVYAAPTRL